jgi:hypothetical protein
MNVWGQFHLTKPLDVDGITHDYYSIWFNFSATFFISEKKTGVIKLQNHFIHLVPCHEMLIIILNC